MYNNKIVIPEAMKKRMISWYHTYLLHQGLSQTKETIFQHFWWKGMQNDIKKYISKCDSCQHLKKQKKHYGHLPMKEAEYKPWEKLCIDLIGEYTIEQKDKNKV